MSHSSENLSSNNALKALFLNHGWKEITSLENSFCRSYEIGSYLWTEEVDITSRQRVSYIQKIEVKLSDFQRAFGEFASRNAHLAGQFCAAHVPVRRTGLGKIRTYLETESLAKTVGAALSEDLVGKEKLFMIIHKTLDSVETAIIANTAEEALMHIKTMLELAGLSEEGSTQETD